MGVAVLMAAGRRFGRLVVLQRHGKNKFRQITWECLCDCGNTSVVVGSSLRSGNTTSCGCYGKSVSKKHGRSRDSTPEYRVWACMLSRCRNANDKGYHNYGGRGIRVCERWLSFGDFLADMGERPSPKHSLDRHPDNNGNYEPGNCRWATKKQQDTNRRTTRLVTFEGETLCIKDWAKKFSIGYDVLLNRFNLGWSPDAAFFTPPNKRGQRYHDKPSAGRGVAADARRGAADAAGV